MAVASLVTLAEIADDGGDPRRMSVSLRHEALLDDGRRPLLLDDRGWTSQLNQDGDIWEWTSAEEVEETARVTVGPDEPFDDRTTEDMEAGHWAYLAGILKRQGVEVEPQTLKGLPHDVVLGERLRARAAHSRPS